MYSVHNAESEEKGCPIQLGYSAKNSGWFVLHPVFPAYYLLLDRINPTAGTPILIFPKETSFALYFLFMTKMGLYPELIQKIWLTFVAKRAKSCRRQMPLWNDEKLDMILNGLLEKIN